jgi:hypothetical protein
MLFYIQKPESISEGDLLKFFRGVMISRNTNNVIVYKKQASVIEGCVHGEERHPIGTLNLAHPD